MEDLIASYIDELKRDYEENGREKEPEVWLKEALIRHIPDMTEERAEGVARDLIKGVRRYRKEKENKVNLRDFLRSKGVEFEKFYNEIAEKIKTLVSSIVTEEEKKDK